MAFQARLGEKFDDQKLREAFISVEYAEAEMKRQRDLQQQDEEDDNVNYQLPTNENLSAVGRKVIEESLTSYVRWALPYLPEEGVEAVVTFLTTEQLLAHVSFHIGTMDLILSEVSTKWVKRKAAALFRFVCQKKVPLYENLI